MTVPAAGALTGVLIGAEISSPPCIMSSPVNGDTRRPNPEETQPRTGQIDGVDAHCARRSPTIPVSSCRYRSWRTASSLSHASFCCNCATTSDSEPPSPPMPPTDGETTRVSSLPPNPRGDGGTLGGKEETRVVSPSVGGMGG